MSEKSYITFSCPGCHCLMRTPPDTGGLIAQCPECGVGMQIPYPSPATIKQTRLKPAQKDPEEEAYRQPPPPTRRRRRSRRRPPPRLPFHFNYSPAVRKIQAGDQHKKTAGIVTLIVLLFLSILWQEQRITSQRLRDRFFREDPAFTGELGPADPPSAANWNFGKAPQKISLQLPNRGKDVIRAAAARRNGNVVITGSMESTQQFPFSELQAKDLFSGQGHRQHGFVAEWNPESGKFLWFRILGGDVIEPTHIALSSDGSIVLGGKSLAYFNRIGLRGSGSLKEGSAAILKLSADGNQALWIRGGQPGQVEVSGLAVDKSDRVLWTANNRDAFQTAVITRVSADGQDAPFPNGNKQGALRIDLSDTEFQAAGQAGNHYSRSQSTPKGFDYDGPGGSPAIRFLLYGVKEGGPIVVLPDGDFITCGSLHYQYTFDGQPRRNGVDILVARFSPQGDLRWSNNLYGSRQPIHVAEQRAIDLAYNEATGEIILLASQSNSGRGRHRLEGRMNGKGDSAQLNWLGRLDGGNGDLKQGWYLESSTGSYSAAGLPVAGEHTELSDTEFNSVAVDGQGRIYVAGLSGPKAWTSPMALQPWPASQARGRNSVLMVLAPRFDQYLFADTLRGSSGQRSRMQDIVLLDSGVWVLGSNADPGWQSGGKGILSNAGRSGDHDSAWAGFAF